jgi:hypothetical protein
MLSVLSAWFGVGCASVFVVTYSATARWWLSDEGRTVVAVGGVFALNSVTTVTLLTFPGGSWEWLARTVVALTGGALMLRLSALVWRAQVVDGGGGKRNEAGQ